MQNSKDLSVPVRTEALRRWLSNRFPSADVEAVSAGRRQRLTGGIGSPLVERVDVRAELADGRYVDDAVLAKRASPAELVAMCEVACVAGVSTFPDLVDSGVDEDGPWLVMPFYPGAALAWDAETPHAVYADLARLHAKWMGRTSALPADVPRVDAEFCRQTLLDFSSGELRELRAATPSPVHDRGLELLHEWANDDCFYAGLARLPVTFLHGDVYGMNILAGGDGSPPKLIDWGSARIGRAGQQARRHRAPARRSRYRRLSPGLARGGRNALGSLASRGRLGLVDVVQQRHVRRHCRRTRRPRPCRRDARRGRGSVGPAR